MYQYKRINEDEYNSALLRLETFFNPGKPADGDEFLNDEEVTLDSLENSAQEQEEEEETY